MQSFTPTYKLAVLSSTLRFDIIHARRCALEKPFKQMQPYQRHRRMCSEPSVRSSASLESDFEEPSDLPSHFDSFNLDGSNTWTSTYADLPTAPALDLPPRAMDKVSASVVKLTPLSDAETERRFSQQTAKAQCERLFMNYNFYKRQFESCPFPPSASYIDQLWLNQFEASSGTQSYDHQNEAHVEELKEHNQWNGALMDSWRKFVKADWTERSSGGEEDWEDNRQLQAIVHFAEQLELRTV